MNKVDKIFIETYYPETINHPAHGIGSLEVKEYDEKCIAQYRHNNGTCSLSSIGDNWNEVNNEMLKIDFSKYTSDGTTKD